MPTENPADGSLNAERAELEALRRKEVHEI
jgi:hypothetical protein